MILALTASAASAAPTPVSSCGTLDSPGAYALSSDLATFDASCIDIAASDVRLDLAGHAITCTGAGFAGSCQTAAFGPTGVTVASGRSGVAVIGPGRLSGFDNGVAVFDSDALVKGVTVAGPLPCDPASCERPVSNAILVRGRSSVNVSGNEVSGYQRGVRLFITDCAGTCVVNGNRAYDNSCNGIALEEATGFTVTRNIVFANGSDACFPTAGIGLAQASGNLIANNDVSRNHVFGLGVAPETNGNAFVNNTALDNALADLRAFPGTSNFWNDNNRCETESGRCPRASATQGNRDGE